MEMERLSDDQPRAKIGRSEPDYAPSPKRPSNCDIFWLVLAIGAHIVDLATDVNVAYQYYSYGEYTYFICTIIIVLVPSVINSLVSARMYIMDAEHEFSVKANQFPAYRCILLLIPLAPILRYIDSLRFALKSRKAEKKGDKEEQEKNYTLMLKEDADVSLLRVFECFLEAAPQQVLQVSYLLRGMPTNAIPGTFSSFSVYHQIFSIVSSFLSMAWALLSYQRNIRFAQEDKDNISKMGSVGIYFWHLFVTVSRIVMLSALASLFWTWTLVAMAVHWIVMTLSLSLVESLEFCSSPMFEHPRIGEHIAKFLFSAVLGLVYIFTYITPVSTEGGNRSRYFGFYGICFIENVGGCVIWNLFTNDSTRQKWFFYPVSGACVIPFVLGCCFMILYYSKCHPQKAPSTGSEPLNIAPPLSPPDVVVNGLGASDQNRSCIVPYQNKAVNA